MLVDVQLFWAVGTPFVGVLALAVLESGHSWRWLAFLAAIPPAAVLMFFSHIPESPRWLISKGRHDEAKNVLTRIARWNGVELGEFTLVAEKEVLFLYDPK